MPVGRDNEEMARWLQRLREYVHGASFDGERRLACQEYLGALAVAWPDQRAAVQAAEAQGEALERRVAESDWFLFHRTHSHWERTPVRLFVEQTPELPDDVAENLLACERSLRSRFEVVAGSADGVIVLDLDGAADDYYRVRLTESQAWVQPGLTVGAQLVRWSGEYWFSDEPEQWPRTVSDILGPPRPQSNAELAADLAATWGRTQFTSRSQWLRARRARR